MANRSGFDVVLRFAQTVIQKKRIVLIGTIVPTLIAIAVVLFSNSVYMSEALINPPKSQGGSPLEALASSSGMGDALGSILGGGETGLNDCVSILESSRFASIVIKRFDLETVYKFKRNGKTKKYYRADLLKKFRKNATYEITDEDAIHLVVKDESAERAKQMADYIVFLLDSLYTDVQQTTIKHRLAYVDNRLEMTLQETRVLEDSMIRFQNTHNLLVPETQIRLILENTTRSELKLETLKEAMALEAVLRGTTSPKYRDMQSEKQLLEKTMNSRLRSSADSNSLLLPTHSLPVLATEYFRLERAYMVRLGVYKYLVQQVELLRLDANKNVQVISVIDPPWVNEKRVSPKRRIVVQTVFVFSFLLSIFTVMLIAAWEEYRRENPGVAQRVRDIRGGLFKFK